MRISVPRRWRDLTLSELQALVASDTPIERLAAVSHRSPEELRALPARTLQKALDHVGRLMAKEEREFVRRLDLSGTQYGLVPNWAELTAGEWLDLEALAADFWPNAHRVMAILYRPITQQVRGGSYEIAKYTGKHPAEPFLDMPAHQVSGALFFFWSAAVSSARSSRGYSKEGEVLARLGLAGAGITRFTNWPGSGSWTWRRLLSGLSALASTTWGIWRRHTRRENAK